MNAKKNIIFIQKNIPKVIKDHLMKYQMKNMYQELILKLCIKENLIIKKMQVFQQKKLKVKKLLKKKDLTNLKKKEKNIHQKKLVVKNIHIKRKKLKKEKFQKQKMKIILIQMKRRDIRQIIQVLNIKNQKM